MSILLTGQSRRTFLKRAAGGVGSLVLAGAGCRDTDTPPASNALSMQSPWINDAEFLGYFVALDKGYYRQEGIDLKYKPGGPEVIAEGELLTRSAQLALAPIETVASLIANEKAPLRIIGSQYQKNPLGVVSLEKNGILQPSDLTGKTLAVPQANVLTVESFLALNGIPAGAVTIVPYQYDPRPLVKGTVDATIDFVTNVPFTIRQMGENPTSFLLWDFGFRVFQDVVVVLDETVRSRRDDLLGWLRASRRGWEEALARPDFYPPLFANTHFKGTGRTIDAEIAFNSAQKPLIESAEGIFSMSPDAIADNVKTLKSVGLEISSSVFDPSLLTEL